MKMRKKSNLSRVKRKKRQQSKLQTGSHSAVVMKKGKLHDAVADIGGAKNKDRKCSGPSGDVHCESTSCEDEVPELLKNKLEKEMLELSASGYESLLIVFTVTKGVIWQNGSALGRQFLEKTPQVTNDLNKFCTEQSEEEEEDCEDFSEPSSPAVHINENQETEKHRADTVDEVKRDPMKDLFVPDIDSMKKEKGNIEMSKASASNMDKCSENSECPRCNKRFAHKRSLNRHVRLFHAKGSSKVSCKLCKRHFNSEEKLAKHMIVHKKRYLCKIEDCAASFSYSHLLDKHKLDCHRDYMNKYRPFLCSVCGDGFLWKRSLKAHMEWKHPAGEPVECDICKKMFRSQTALTGHRLSHRAVIGYVCELCGASYKYRCGLFKHKKCHHRQIQSQARKFVCEVCGREYKEDSSLHHHIVSTNHITPTQTIGNRTVYECDKCDKKFGLKDKYDRHYVSVHTKEPVRTCSYCGKGFCDSSNYKQHLRTHTGLKPTCEICKSTFRSVAALKKHTVQFHTTEKEVGANRPNIETNDNKLITTETHQLQVQESLSCEVARPVYILTQQGSQCHTTFAIDPATSHTHENIAVIKQERPYMSPLDVQPYIVTRPDNVAMLHVEENSVSLSPVENCIDTSPSTSVTVHNSVQGSR